MSTDHQLALERAERHCGEHGVRLTAKRKQVLACLLETGRAISAYDLVAHLRREHQLELPPMTVYRILEFLQGENLVHKLLSTNKFVACSHISCDHSHEVPQFLICGSCDRVKEVGVGRAIITALREQVEKARFQLQSEQLELYCLCNDCARAPASDAAGSDRKAACEQIDCADKQFFMAGAKSDSGDKDH